MKKKQIYSMVLTALFIAAGIVLSYLNPMIRFGDGGAGMRISFSSYISVIPSFLFGPLYGGAAMGIIDVFLAIFKPDGPFLFPLTVTAILGGVLRALFWKIFKTKKLHFLPFLSAFIVIFLFGLINMLIKDSNFAYSQFISGFGKKTMFFTLVPMIIGIVSGAVLIISKTVFPNEKYLNVFAALLPANIIITTLNTAILLLLVPSLSHLSFTVFFIPRLIEEITSTSIQSCVVSYLLKLTDKLK